GQRPHGPPLVERLRGALKPLRCVQDDVVDGDKQGENQRRVGQWPEQAPPRPRHDRTPLMSTTPRTPLPGRSPDLQYPVQTTSVQEGAKIEIGPSGIRPDPLVASARQPPGLTDAGPIQPGLPVGRTSRARRAS